VCVWVGFCVSWDAVVTASHVSPCSLPVDGGTGEASR